MPGGEIELTFGPWLRQPLEREPVTVGVPFPPGALPSANEACLLDGDAELYCQRRVLSTWPGGSVRWLLLDFQADLPAARPKALRIVYGRGAAKAVLGETGISLTEERTQIVIDNGPLRLVCNARPFSLFESVHLHGSEVLSSREPVDFRVVDLSGQSYTASGCQIASVTVEAGGPLRAAVRFEGSHVDEAKRPLLDFAVLVTTWSDKPCVAVEYQMIHRGADESVELQEASCTVTFAPRAPARFATGAADSIGPGRGIEVHRTHDAVAIDMPRELSHPRSTCPDACLASPWLDRADGGRGMAVGVRHAVQQLPKRLSADGKSLTVAFYPPADVPLCLRQGSAKSHEMLFTFHGGEPDTEAIARRYRLFDLAPRPCLPAAWYHQARAFGSLSPTRPLFHLDTALDQAFDHRPRAMGILHFGDEPHPAGQWRVGCGEHPSTQPPSQPSSIEHPASSAIVWSNNACDLAHALFLHWARTGQVRHFAAAEAIVRHVIDVDHIHFSNDPLRDGGVAQPSVQHTRDGLVSPACQTIEGILDYHYLTGSHRAMLAVRRIGDNVLRHVPGLIASDPDGPDPESLGWALYTVATLCREIGRPQYFDAARKLIDHLAEFSASGETLAALCARRAPEGRVPGIAVVLTAIQRYHLVSKEQRAADLLLRELDALLAGGTETLWGQPCCPASRPALHADALLLEPLAFAHQLSGDASYLEIGQPLVRHLVLGGGLRLACQPAPDHQLVGDAWVHRPVLAPLSGLAIAQVVRPLLAYLAAAESAGLLDELGL